AHSKRRLIYGIKEILKHLKAEGINIVFVAKDFEIFKDCSTDLTNSLEEIIEVCNRRNIPVIHASTRSKFSHHLNKPGSISIIGIVDYSGAEELYNEMMKKKEKSDGISEGNVEDTDV
uniref:Ribosomal protein L7Ae/L30e/S12e/Gadd45 domain-containing protein n=1 Tax=Panagrolaimus sp. JU765 TaxID=591449 RepID=A0AC34R5W3_9BILA